MGLFALVAPSQGLAAAARSRIKTFAQLASMKKVVGRIRRNRVTMKAPCLNWLMPLSALLLVTAPQARADIVLSETSFESGGNYAAFFKVEQGCGASATVSLEVRIADGVTVLDLPVKPGWRLSAERVPLPKPLATERGVVKERVTAVTWRGRLEANAADQFGLFVKLPDKTGPLYFPAVQHCQSGETRWTDIPAPGQAQRDLPHPAPVLNLIAAAATVSPHYMAGSIMIEKPWSRATPPGAPTAAAYLTIMNHGAAADIFLGGATPAAAKLEIHQMSMANGVMTMRAAPGGIPIAGGAQLELKPDGGYHLMLSGLKAPLKAGTILYATLIFAKAGSVEVEFRVEAIGARGPAEAAADHSTHDHH
jgi:copper(I)-binding protein/uncharacterized protein YcnI